MGSQRAAQRDQQHREQMRGDKGVRVLKGKRRKRGDREVLVLHGALYAPSVGGGLLHCGRVARLCSPMAGCLPSSLQALHENEWLLGTGGCWGYGAAWGHGAVGVGVRSPAVPMLQHLHAGSQRWDHPTQPWGRFCPAQVRQAPSCPSSSPPALPHCKQRPWDVCTQGCTLQPHFPQPRLFGEAAKRTQPATHPCEHGTVTGKDRESAVTMQQGLLHPLHAAKGTARS